MIGQTERGVLLLCSSLGDRSIRPLTMAQFRRLSLQAAAMGRGEGDPLSQLRERDLMEMGCTAEESRHILMLLDREAMLDRYLARAERLGIYPLTRLSPGYPARLWEQLGMDCPPVLFCCGDAAILQRPGVALDGSRRLEAPGRAFARRIGTLAAQEGLALFSGVAMGADTVAQEACLGSGGQVAAFLADSLAGRLEQYDRPAGLLLISEQGYAEPFSAVRAHDRNRLIHAMGQSALVAQSDYGSGGTWTGTLENLKHEWSPVFVCDDGSRGAQGLIERGATALPPEGPKQLSGLRAQIRQMSLFS